MEQLPCEVLLSKGGREEEWEKVRKQEKEGRKRLWPHKLEKHYVTL